MTTVALPHPPSHPPTAATPAVPRRPQTVGAAWGQREWLRLRWGVRAALLLGVAASVVANILHATPNPISQAIAAWPPLALLFTVELIARVPVHRRSLAAARLLAATAIAGIAAYVSYWHMVGVAARYGETGASPYLLPLSVDGLIIVASISLVEISGRLHTLTSLPAAGPTTPALSPTAPSNSAGTPSAAVRPHRECESTPPPAAAPLTTPPMPLGRPAAEPCDEAPAHRDDTTPEHPQLSADQHTAPDTPPDASLIATVQPAPVPKPHPDPADEDQEEAPAAPRDAITYWLRRQPDIGIDELAERIGKSPRQTRRYLGSATTTPKVNGRRNDAAVAALRSETS